ncbi:MAG: hypothetical protein WBB24_13645 [Maribacter sp.]
MIREFLFYEDSNNKEEKKNYLDLKIQIRELIKDSFDRKILTEILLDLRKDLSGQSQEVLLKLYVDLGLHHDAYDKLTSLRWPTISKGILELTAMNVSESYGMILKLINHRNGTIRKQAELAIVNLKEEGISFFLDNTKYKISEWQQLKLLDVLRHKENFTPPQFSLWLTSNNTHVVLFSLRLIKYYKQSDAIKSIVTLLKHKNNSIKMEAIDCTKEFYVFEGLATLKLIYWKSNMGVKIAILDAIGEIGSNDDLEFLKIAAQKEKIHNIKSKVLGTINKIEPEHYVPTKNIQDLSYYSKDSESATEEELQNQACLLEEHVNTEPVVRLQNEAEAEFVGQEIEDKIGEIDISNSDEHPLEVSEKEEASVLTIQQLEEITLEHDQRLIENPFVEEKSLEQLSFDFLPVIVENDIQVIQEEMMEECSDFNIGFSLDEDFHQETGDSSIENIEQVDLEDIEAIDWNILFNSGTLEEKIAPFFEKDEIANEKVSEFPENHNLSISPIFLDDADLETMVLLEDIDDLGDERELALLHQLLKEESSPIIVDRVNELIEKFSQKYSDDILTEEKPFERHDKSVFEALFELSDRETRIVLLNEMAASGGAKEISLVKRVLNEKDQELKKLAQIALEKISERKSSGAQQEFDQQLSHLLRIDFELTLESGAETPQTNRPSGGTLFDHLCSFPNNFYNSKNG